MAWRAEAALAIALAGAAACGVAGGGDGGGDDVGDGDDGMPYEPGGLLADRACPADSFLTYGNFGGPFFSEYCTGCHSSQLPAAMRQDAPPGVDFETLDDIRARADTIYQRAADGYSIMPPVGGPSDDTRVLLGEWLACGAPE
ncbi:MAG TPA: hypothetical protein VKB80_33915 [Kofleriaceae bacterium]|nr:hypothetical protein [Kofleriaceae bacterium]